MASLYGLAGKLVGDLCSPLFNDHVGKPWELETKSEFEKLKNTVSAIQAVLLDAEEKQNTNHQVRDWLIKIKPVFYDLEDLLQEVSYEALKRQVETKNKKAKKVQIFFSGSNQIKYRIKMGRKVKLIKDQLDAIVSDSNRFSLAQEKMPATTTRSHRREETHSFVPLDKFIGRDEDKEKVKKLLLESDGDVSVISVIGIGGMGKTTLAQSIYSLEEVNCNFELKMWVCVSEPFDVKVICENIIESATKRKCERVQMDGVMDELKKAIDGRKYLLVLDDVWNECPDEWMKLQVLLAGGAKGSKILITARAELVARTAKSVETHVLKGFCPEKSWELFAQVAFNGRAEPQSSKMVEIGKEVTERCAGVPLAIKTTAGMLGLKEREADWVDFKKNVLPGIARDGKGKILPILKLSYDNLSAPLKRCFTFCAVYPKDCEFQKESLIRMWMAHGLIELDGTSRSLEDVGENYFMDLRDRSLFEVYRITSYKMHDLIHDLAFSVGENEFWSSGLDVNDINVRTRHAWVSNPDPCISTKLLHAKKLRTLVSGDVSIGDFKQLRVLEYFRFSGIHIHRLPNFVGRLRFLSYLNLSYCEFGSVPESISSMYKLQTFILSCCTNMKELPKGTRNLVSLRHLDISGYNSLSHMPPGMGDLTSLRTLTDFVSGPEGINCSELGVLKSLVNLKGELTISDLRGSKVAKCTSSGESCYPIAELQFITGLELWWRREDEVDKNDEQEADEFESLKPHPNLETPHLRLYGGKGFPSWMDGANIGNSLPNIRSIQLYSCKGLRHLQPLGLLLSLRELTIWGMDALQYIYDIDEDEEWNNNNNTYFPALKKLDIRFCPLLVADGKQFMSLNSLHELGFRGCMPEWFPSLPHLQTLDLSLCKENVALPEWIGDVKSLLEIRLDQFASLSSIPECVQHLTSLQKIILEDCPSLASIPDCVQHLTSLRQLKISGCAKLYRRYNKENGEDWHKISHITNVFVTELW